MGVRVRVGVSVRGRVTTDLGIRVRVAPVRVVTRIRARFRA